MVHEKNNCRSKGTCLFDHLFCVHQYRFSVYLRYTSLLIRFRDFEDLADVAPTTIRIRDFFTSSLGAKCKQTAVIEVCPKRVHTGAMFIVF